MEEDKNVEYFILDKPVDNYLLKFAQLHIAYLSDGGFLTLLGLKFINALYKDILIDRLGFFVYATIDNEIVGYTLGCENSELLFKIVKKKFLKYSIIILPVIIRNPGYILKVIETLSYNKIENTDIKAEILVGITEANVRSRGIGISLVNISKEEFLKRNISEYKATVHADMKLANKFQLLLGMDLVSTFKMYGVKWNLYIGKTY